MARAAFCMIGQHDNDGNGDNDDNGNSDDSSDGNSDDNDRAAGDDDVNNGILLTGSVSFIVRTLKFAGF